MKSNTVKSAAAAIMALAALTLGSGSQAYAAAIIDITQSGTDVIMTGSGSINLGGLAFSSTSGYGSAGVIPGSAGAGVGVASGTVDIYNRDNRTHEHGIRRGFGNFGRHRTGFCAHRSV